MADTIGLSDVSSEDTSKLKTGGSRLYNMNSCPSGQVYDKKEKRCKKQKK